MLTRRQALQVLLASPALRVTPVAAAPLTYTAMACSPPTISLPGLRPGESINVFINGKRFFVLDEDSERQALWDAG
jgi:hypothetical protein